MASRMYRGLGLEICRIQGLGHVYLVHDPEWRQHVGVFPIPTAKSKAPNPKYPKS